MLRHSCADNAARIRPETQSQARLPAGYDVRSFGFPSPTQKDRKPSDLTEESGGRGEMGEAADRELQREEANAKHQQWVQLPSPPIAPPGREVVQGEPNVCGVVELFGRGM